MIQAKHLWNVLMRCLMHFVYVLLMSRVTLTLEGEYGFLQTNNKITHFLSLLNLMCIVAAK